ncbi:RidA family protein [Streptomyces sulphureus]|uniref:RidA family protein n=1 Tax=Streptomyces sulphureus TaxID=47758 RepID=UPI00036D3CD7|nr:RidA family protein [Streptomyces sulphureus]
MTHPELEGLRIPSPQGHYQPVRRCGAAVATAGMTPRAQGEMRFPGVVGADVALDDAREAARIAVRNALLALTLEDEELARVRLLRMTVYVAAVAGFRDHSRVADAASDVLARVLAERGACARSAIGVASLPSGACVEIELTAALE